MAALEALIAGGKVRCEVVERDRPVAKVFSPNGVDITCRLVSAMAYRRYSMNYVAAENEATREMCRGTFVHPTKWRAPSPPPRAQPSMLDSCRDATAAGWIVIRNQLQ